MLKSTGTQITQRLIHKLPVLDIENPHARAVVSLHGAQVLSFQPSGEEKVLWLSPDSMYREDQAIRGGIPVCWPWFGKRAEESPAHGFARTELWRLEQQETLAGGETRLLLSLHNASHSKWLSQGEQATANLSLEIIIGSQLQLTLTTENSSDQSIEISQALHTYFAISDIEKISISGLDDMRFLDHLDDKKAYVQKGDVTFSGEVDRTYLDSTETTIIHDPGMERNVVIKKSGSNSTVVWNPWKVRSKEMIDMPDEGYKSMVCVESATTPDLPVELEPGASHKLTARIGVERAN
ncbi:MAG: D-hexose-6-phosphate mutarotase [Endozoicomonas sp.]